MFDGLVVVDKPAGWTSHDVVGKLRKIYQQRRVGHAGTLDPDATGVLLVGLGRVTRLLRYLQDAGKEYRGSVVFGTATDTLDASGEVCATADMHVTTERVEAAARSFIGDIEQVPPMVSAIKVGGRKLYELARKGEEVERAARRVHVDELVVEGFEPGPPPVATIRVACSSGTYIRTLAADLGTALGGYAHLGALRRLRVGGFGLAEARPIAQIEADRDAAVLTPADATRGLERAVVDDEIARAVGHGKRFDGATLAVAGPGPYAVVDRDGVLLAIYERNDGGVKPAVVLAAEAAAS